MTWAELRDHLTATYLVGETDDEWIELWWTFVHDAARYRQHETVRLATAFGEPAVIIAAELETYAIPDREALRHNASLAIGAIVAESDRLAVRALLPLSTLTPELLDRALHAVAHESARLAIASPRAAVHAELAYYAD